MGLLYRMYRTSVRLPGQLLHKHCETFLKKRTLTLLVRASLYRLTIHTISSAVACTIIAKEM